MNSSLRRSTKIIFATGFLAASLSIAAPVQDNNAPEIPEWMKDGSTPPPPPSIPAELEAIANQPAQTVKIQQRQQGPTGISSLGKPPALPANLKTPPPPPSLRPGSSRPQMANTNDASVQSEQSFKASGLAASGTDLDASMGTIEFSDLAVSEILDMLQNMTGKTVLRQSAVNGTLSFRSQGTLTRGQAIEALTSLLALNGVAVTPLGDLYLKAVPATSAANHSPRLIEGSTLEYSPSQEVCSKLFVMDFMPTTEAVPALNSMQSGLVGTSITAFEKNRTILATDSLVNLQRMETLLERIDRPYAAKDKILFFPLRNISASDAQKRSQQMLTGAMASRFTGNTTVDADERTNQLIVYTHPSNEALITQLVENIDKDVDPLTRTELFNIRHADATELCDIIKEVVTGQEQARDSTQTNNNFQRQRVQTSAANVQTATAANDSASSQFSSSMTIVADERTNNIVATGTASDLRLLGKMIEQLDALLPQVRIEVVITEVTLANGESRGLDQFGIRYAETAPSSSLTGTVEGDKQTWLSPSFAGGLSVTPFSLDDFAMEMVFSVAKTNSNVQVLSAPNIVTTHNREASILVGSREPVVTTAVTNSDSSDNDMVANIDYQDIALELTVKPLIGSNGVIQMEITQKINEVTSRVTLAGLGQQPVIGTRQASSFVSVGNGQMVVLGGLQKVTDTKNHDKVFILGDIPILGRLFSPKDDEVKRTELLIFIRPVIIGNPAEAEKDAREKISQMKTGDKVLEYLESGNFKTEDEKKPESSKWKFWKEEKEDWEQ
ncbi:MAG: hypothetical protein JW942_02905 [Opitutales bacterium]|nr:hypothetical protein [Opitutales bacterium]